MFLSWKNKYWCYCNLVKIKHLQFFSVPKVLVAQLCPTLCNPMDCGLPGISVHGILQARILEWVTIPFSRGSSWPRDWTQVSHIAGRFFTIWATSAYIHTKVLFHWSQGKWNKNDRINQEATIWHYRRLKKLNDVKTFIIIK